MALGEEYHVWAIEGGSERRTPHVVAEEERVVTLVVIVDSYHRDEEDRWRQISCSIKRPDLVDLYIKGAGKVV